MNTSCPDSAGNRKREYYKVHPARLAQLLLFDILCSTLASLVAVLTVRWLGDPFGSLKHFVYIWATCGCICSLVGFIVMGTYRIVLIHSSYRSIGRLMSATAIKEALLALMISTGILRLSWVKIEFLVLAFDLVFSIGLLVFVRVIIISIYDIILASPESKINSLFALVYGTSNKSVAMVTRFKSSPNYNVVGYITRDHSKSGLKLQSTKVYAFDTKEDLLALKRELGIDCILFANQAEYMSEKDLLVPQCLAYGIHVIMAPSVEDLTATVAPEQTASPVSEKPVQSDTVEYSPRAVLIQNGEKISDEEIDFIPDGMSSMERGVKRLFSIIISVGCLIVFSPLFLMIWIAIKMEDGGPAIYKQERIGRFGRPFNIYKFRSMRTDAESFGPALYAGEDDPRLTKVGRFIRAHHLDELPQLWNVFCGDMAFVGPRPERKYFIDQIIERDPRYSYLYQIRPGVTSYATYYNGYTDTIEKMLTRLRYDLYYLKHRSWWFDIKVLWMTFRSIMFGKKF